MTTSAGPTGVASSGPLVADATVGRFEVTATAPGVTTPAVFSLANEPAPSPAVTSSGSGATGSTARSPLVLRPFAATSAGTITGTVTDASGTGVPGICVSAVPNGFGGIRTGATTGTGGTYSITSLAAGSYVVEFTDGCGNAGNYADQYYANQLSYAAATPVTVMAASTTPGIDASLQPGGAITGTVTDASGTGLSGICVSTFDSSTGSGAQQYFTAANGSYSVLGLATGSYTVTFSGCGGSANYITQTYPTPVSVTAGSTAPNIDATLQPGGTISGTVTDASGTGLSGICVNAAVSGSSGLGGFANTGSGGTYSIVGLATGSYTVTFSGCGGSANYITQTYPTPVSVTAGSTAPNIDATLQPGGTISGTVTDASGTGLSGICVDAFGSSGLGGSANTGTGGTYSITGLATGSYTVSFRPGCGSTGNYLSQTDPTQVSVTAGSSTPNIDATLQPGGTITGTVTDTSGTGLSGICVNAAVSGSSGLGGSGTTGTGGTYSITGLATGSYTVTFSGCGITGNYISQTYPTPVSVTAGSSTPNIDATMQPGGTISGTVTDTSGTGLSGICVSAYDPSTGSGGPSATTGTGGTYSLVSLPTGSYTVTFSTGCGNSANYLSQNYATPVSVTAGSTSQGIDATMQPPITGLTGTVTDATTGTPIPGVCAYLYNTAGQRTSDPGSCADSAGSFVMPVATPGTYVVGYLDPSGAHVTTWSGGGTSEASATPVTVSAGTSTNASVAMGEVQAVTGTVTDTTTGAPVAGVCAYLYTTAGQRTSDPGACTGATGSFVMPVATPGTYVVGYLDPSGTHATTWSGGATTEASAIPVTVAAGASTNGSVAMGEVQAVTGTVTDAHTDAAIAGVCAYLYTTAGQRTADPGTCTGANGTYTMPVATPGTYVIGFLDPSGTHVTTWSGGATTEASATPVTVIAGTNTADVAMGEVQGIAGVVTSSATGQGLSGVCVYADYASGPNAGSYSGVGSCTGADGSYLLSGLAAGTYAIGYYLPGQAQGGSAPPTTYWYDGTGTTTATTEAASTPVAVVAGVTTPGIGATVP